MGATCGRIRLEAVGLELSPGGVCGGVSTRCRRGRVRLESGDFRLEGGLQGEFSDGRVLGVAWVAYDDQRGLLYSNAPITIEEPGAHYRAGGFRYRIEKGELRLLGGVEVVRGR